MVYMNFFSLYSSSSVPFLNTFPLFSAGSTDLMLVTVMAGYDGVLISYIQSSLLIMFIDAPECTDVVTVKLSELYKNLMNTLFSTINLSLARQFFSKISMLVALKTSGSFDDICWVFFPVKNFANYTNPELLRVSKFLWELSFYYICIDCNP